MNKGVEILLARMESHPEEFLRDKDRWEGLFNHYKKYMAEEDKEIFWAKLCELRTQEFTEKVMKTLFDDKKEEAKRRKVASIQEVVDAGIDLAWKEAYAKCVLDSFTYSVKNRTIWKDEK